MFKSLFAISDEQAMWRVQTEDDHAAFALLVERWREKIRQLCIRMTGNIQAAFPLTPLQEGMLYHTIRDPALGVFHVQCTAWLDGPLVIEHFTRAWELATERHAALRTFFAWEGRERPLQVVRSVASINVQVMDWRDLGEAAQLSQWTELTRRDRARGPGRRPPAPRSGAACR